MSDVMCRHQEQQKQEAEHSRSTQIVHVEWMSCGMLPLGLCYSEECFARTCGCGCADLTYQFLSDTQYAIAHPKLGHMSPTGLRASQVVDVTLTILNTYWVSKMFQGGMKMLKKQNIDDPKYRSD